MPRRSQPQGIPTTATHGLHKFSVGQRVEFLAGVADRNVPRGSYTVTQALPGDDFDRTYRARSSQDGLERVFRESQLRAMGFAAPA